MRENIENLADTEVDAEENIETIFDGELINIRGNSEQIKKIIENILKMNEWNVRNFSKHVDEIFSGNTEYPLNGDFLTPSGKMVRLYIKPPIKNEIEVNLGGGGNSISSEEMKKEIEKATGLTF